MVFDNDTARGSRTGPLSTEVLGRAEDKELSKFGGNEDERASAGPKAKTEPGCYGLWASFEGPSEGGRSPTGGAHSGAVEGHTPTSNRRQHRDAESSWGKGRITTVMIPK